MAIKPPTIAVTSTLAMVRAAGARGVETADVLEGAGVNRAYLEDPDARLPGPTVLAIWNALRERTADPTLQLVAPAALPWGAYRIIDYLTAASTTVGDGVGRFARFFGLIADAVSLGVEGDGNEHHLCLRRADGGAVPPVYVDYVFAALVSRVRMRIKPDLEVLRVELQQARLPDPTPYERLFRAPVHFGAAADRLTFSSEEWDAPTVTGDTALAQLLEEHARVLARRVPGGSAGFEADVRRAISSGLPEGGSVEHVARGLHVSVRTLQRKLVAAGTTFKEVSDTVRGRLAEEYLADPSVSIAEVAFLLGFSDQSSFNRAFGRWTGVSPGKWRRRQA